MWFVKQLEELTAVENWLEATARLCMLVGFEATIDDHYPETLLSLSVQCDSLPRLPSLLAAPDLTDLPRIVAASWQIQLGVDSVHSRISAAYCATIGLPSPAIAVSCRDVYGEPVVGLLAEDFAIALPSSVSVIPPVSVRDDGIAFSILGKADCLASGLSTCPVRVTVSAFDAVVGTATIQFGRPITGTRIKTIETEYNAFNTGIAVHPSGDTIAVGNWNSHSVRLYRVSDGRCLCSIGSRGSGRLQLSDPAKLCFAPDDGNLLIAEDTNNRVQEVTVLGEFVRFFVIDSEVRSVTSVDATQTMVAIGVCGLTPDSLTVRLFPRLGGDCFRSFAPRGAFKGIRDCQSLRFSPDGKHILVIDFQRVSGLTLFDLNGSLVSRFTCATECNDVAFAPNGDLLVCSRASNSVSVLSAVDGSPLNTFAQVGWPQCQKPTSLASCGGRLYVLDNTSTLVHVFE